MGFIVKDKGTTYIDNLGGQMSWKDAEELLERDRIKRSQERSEKTKQLNAWKHRAIEAYSELNLICGSYEAFEESTNMLAAFVLCKKGDDYSEETIKAFMHGFSLINQYDWIVMTPQTKSAYESETLTYADKDYLIVRSMRVDVEQTGCIIGKYCKFISGVLPKHLEKPQVTIELDERDWRERL